MPGLPLAHSRIRFGVFELDLQTGELRKSGVLLHLPPQPFKVLVLLASRPSQLVTREEFRSQIWGTETFVDFEHGLNAAIRKIRDTLSDDSETPRYIETLPRRGYRFIASVEGNQPGRTQPLQLEPPASLKRQIVTDMLAMRLPRQARMLIIAGSAVAMLAVGGYFYFQHTPKLTGRDSIVLADFTNTTGDPVFDGTLRQGLSVQFEQSPYFNILSGDEVAEQMRLMEKPPNTRLTQNIAREVCERLNAKAEIEGSIAALGNQYVIGLNAVNCHTGETLAEEQATAEGKRKVLAALGEAASKLRSKLGESRASLAAYDVPLVRATTSSLDALQVFNQCEQEFFRSDYLVGISFCQQAVSIDPNFASAYGLLAILYANLNENDLEAEAIKKAYELRGRTSEREKLLILCTYHFYGTQDLEKALQVAEQYVQTYPRDERAFIGLGNAYRLLGRYDDAIAADLEVTRLDPSNAVAHELLAMTYISMNRFADAQSIIERARTRSLNSQNFGFLPYEISFLQKNSTALEAQSAHLPLGTRAYLEAWEAAYRGQFSRSRDLVESSIASTTQPNAREVAVNGDADSAVRAALVGNFTEAKRAAGEALALKSMSSDWDTEGRAAVALALAGDSEQAQRLASDLNRRFPKATYVQLFYLPEIRAAAALRNGNPVEAIENLRAGISCELTSYGMFAAYLRGRAYLSTRQGVQAAGEFQKLVDSPGLVLIHPIGPLAHLGLARAYALQGDTLKAKAAYRDFLTLWKDADSNIPILEHAKAEYAKLQ